MSPWPITSSTRHPAKTVPGGSWRAAVGGGAAAASAGAAGRCAGGGAGTGRRARRRRAAARRRRRAGGLRGPTRGRPASVSSSVVAPDAHRVTRLERRWLAHAHAVHEGPVGRPEVLDRRAAPGVAGHARVAARELGVVAEPPSPLSARPITSSSSSASRRPWSAAGVDHDSSSRRPGVGTAGERELGRLRDAARGVGDLRASVCPIRTDVAQRERARRLDALAVHERPVRRSRGPRSSARRPAPREARAWRARDLGVVAEPARAPRRPRGR